MRVLLLGPINIGHFEDMAHALANAGVDVVAAGEIWAGRATVLPDAEAVDGPFVPWLRRLVRRTRPDVVHAHWTPFAAKALFARARPLVVQPWGSDVYRAAPLFRAANIAVARLADAVVADSEDLLAVMIRSGARPGRAHVVRWGVDLELFRPEDGARERLGLGGGPIVLSPRALKPFYNADVLLEAHAHLRTRIPGLELILKHTEVDAPPGYDALPEGVRLIGRVPYEKMADWYRAADVCVSIPDTDSSPRSVWEAMACGTPCVVSDLPWARAELRDGEDAVLVQPEPHAVAETLERLLSDHDGRRRLGDAGRAASLRTQDRSAHLARLIDVYRAL